MDYGCRGGAEQSGDEPAEGRTLSFAERDRKRKTAIKSEPVSFPPLRHAERLPLLPKLTGTQPHANAKVRRNVQKCVLRPYMRRMCVPPPASPCSVLVVSLSVARVAGRGAGAFREVAERGKVGDDDEEARGDEGGGSERDGGPGAGEVLKAVGTES
jgi:hypothetical protein